jgi:hypothetical protein
MVLWRSGRRILACRLAWDQARRTARAARLRRVALVPALLLAAAAAPAQEAAPKPQKPASFAPHPTAQRSFGAPVQAPILHKHRKLATPASSPAPAARPATARRTVPDRKPREASAPPDRALPPDPAYHPPATDGVH